MTPSRAVLLLAVVGCGGGSIKIEDMPAEASKVLCAKAYECCTAAETAKNQTVGPDQSSCETKTRSGLDIIKNFTSSGEMKGRVTYHGDKMKQCLDAYAKKTCADLKKSADDMITECDGVFEPKVAVGGDCAQDNECISGSCTGSLNAEGKCVEKASVGGNCDDADCTDDAYCSFGSRPDGGSGGSCVAKKADGAACRNNGDCVTGGCNGKNPDGGMPNMGTCGEKGGPGTTCFVTDGCSVAGGTPLILLALIALRRRRRS